MTTRKPAVLAVTLLMLAFIAFSLWQYTSPFPLRVPRDRSLIAFFHGHRQAFQEIVDLAVIDAPRHSSIEGLRPERRSEYLRLLNQINLSSNDLGFFEDRVTFWCAGGGILLAIGPSWSKGIVYLPWGLARQGEVVSSTDKNPGRDGIYLVPIEEKWYLIYQRFDYDDWRKKNPVRPNQLLEPTAGRREVHF
jgi:hypothetical protein